MQNVIAGTPLGERPEGSSLWCEEQLPLPMFLYSIENGFI
jgi:hypothetical protein